MGSIEYNQNNFYLDLFLGKESAEDVSKVREEVGKIFDDENLDNEFTAGGFASFIETNIDDLSDLTDDQLELVYNMGIQLDEEKEKLVEGKEKKSEVIHSLLEAIDYLRQRVGGDSDSIINDEDIVGWVHRLDSKEMELMELVNKLFLVKKKMQYMLKFESEVFKTRKSIATIAPERTDEDSSSLSEIEPETQPWGEVEEVEGSGKALGGKSKYKLKVGEQYISYNDIDQFDEISDVGADGKRVLEFRHDQETRFVLCDKYGHFHKEEKIQDFLNVSDCDELGNRFIYVNDIVPKRGIFILTRQNVPAQKLYVHINKEGNRNFWKNGVGKDLDKFQYISIHKDGKFKGDTWFDLYPDDNTLSKSTVSNIVVGPDGKQKVTQDDGKREFIFQAGMELQ